MRFAYADATICKPREVLDSSSPAAQAWDDTETIRGLVERMLTDFPEGWALSLTSSNLRQVLSVCPYDVRIAAWCQPRAVLSPQSNPAFSWEPVILMGGRKRRRSEWKIRDWLSETNVGR